MNYKKRKYLQNVTKLAEKYIETAEKLDVDELNVPLRQIERNSTNINNNIQPTGIVEINNLEIYDNIEENNTISENENNMMDCSTNNESRNENIIERNEFTINSEEQNDRIIDGLILSFLFFSLF